MRNFQSFTLAMMVMTMMMIGTACAAPTSALTPAPVARASVDPNLIKDMLVRIHQFATVLKENLTHSHHIAHFVDFPKPKGLSTCETKFFCFAEESLVRLNKTTPVEEANALIRQLHQYNLQNDAVKCNGFPEDPNHQILLKKLLKDIIYCSEAKHMTKQNPTMKHHDS